MRHLRAAGASPSAASSPVPSWARPSALSISSETAKPPRPAGARHVAEIGAAQAATGRKQRQGLDEIGLAGAVVAGQRRHLRVHPQVERGVGAEIAQNDAPHPAESRVGRIVITGQRAHARVSCQQFTSEAKAPHTRIGIST
jgi:hypothetical protein